MDQTEALPHDMLANIFRRLPACDLAASRCVRKTWRATVDARGLLLPHVLPHSVHGIFVNYIDYERPHCFSRPSAHKPVIDGNLDFLPGYTVDFNPIVDHCNGLVLYETYGGKLYVANPATRRWDCIWDYNYHSQDYDFYYPYLAFDPRVSPHYEVFSIPDVPKKLVPDEQEDTHGSMDWPPSSWILDVFSSSARQWHKRSFLRQGEAAGTVTSIRADPWKPIAMCFGGARRRYAVYWDGSLYVHCRGVFVARLSLSSGKYQVIKMPPEIQGSKSSQFLGKSEKGVSLATIHDERRLRFFNLVESDGQIDWVLKYHVNLEPLTSLLWKDFKGFKKTWTLDDGSNVMMVKKKNICWGGGGGEDGEEEKGDRKNNGILIGENLEWNFEDDDDEEENEGDTDADTNDDDDDDNDDDDDDDDDDGDDNDEDDDDDDYDDDDDDDADDDEDEGEGEEEKEEKEREEGENDEIQIRENMEWNSDDDNVVNIEDDSSCGINLYFLGFHPYKEVVFLGLSSSIGVAYHLRSSKIQYLGKMRPKDYYSAHTNGMYEGYPYTPCMIGELQNHASTSRRRG